MRDVDHPHDNRSHHVFADDVTITNHVVIITNHVVHVINVINVINDVHVAEDCAECHSLSGGSGPDQDQGIQVHGPPVSGSRGEGRG